MTPDGTLTKLHSFQGEGGVSPNGRLIQAIDGNFYGTTQSGGIGGLGTVFRMTPDGTVSRFYTFLSTAAGAFPQGGVTQAIDGNFYGTVDKGGLHGIKVASIDSMLTVTSPSCIHLSMGNPWEGSSQRAICTCGARLAGNRVKVSLAAYHSNTSQAIFSKWTSRVMVPTRGNCLHGFRKAG